MPAKNTWCDCGYSKQRNYANYFDKPLDWADGDKLDKERLITLTLIDIHFILNNISSYGSVEKAKHKAEHRLIDLINLGFFDLYNKKAELEFFQSIKADFPNIKSHYRSSCPVWKKALLSLNSNMFK